jgi:hypothetical protein
MNKDGVLNIIEATLKGGDKTPGLLDLPKIMGIKSKIQSCSSINDVLVIIDGHRILISKAFGLSNDAIEKAKEKLKALES